MCVGGSSRRASDASAFEFAVSAAAGAEPLTDSTQLSSTRQQKRKIAYQWAIMAAKLPELSSSLPVPDRQ